MVQRQIGVGQRLCLYALGRIDDQHRPLTGGQRTGDLVVEVHVTGGVNEIQLIDLAVICGVVQLDRAGFNGNAALPLDFHIVQDLLLHVVLGNGIGELQQSVCQSGLAMVNMGNDGKVPNMIFVIGHVKFRPSRLFSF